jgi:hypothetical protein
VLISSGIGSFCYIEFNTGTNSSMVRFTMKKAMIVGATFAEKVNISFDF